MRASESHFQSYKSKWILSFTNLTCSSVSGSKALKKCLRFAILYSEKLWNVFKIVLEKGEVFVQKALSLTKHFKRKISQTPFCCLCDNLPTVKMSFSSLQCLSQVKKVIQENSAKYVNQTGNIYFQAKT